MDAPTTGRSEGNEPALNRLSGNPVLGPLARLMVRRREQLLYLAVGGWNTVFGYATWALLQFTLGERLHYLVVVVISWPIAVLNAYLCYRYIVFRSRGPILHELPRFSTVYIASLLANLAVLPVALKVLPLNLYAIQAGFAVLVVVASYLAHKYFSFGASPPASAESPGP